MENGVDWARLAKEVLARRHTLGVSQEELARRGGPSHQSIRNIEAGNRAGYRELTLARLEQVLCWKPGTVRRILNGTAGDDPDKWLLPTPDEVETFVRLLEGEVVRHPVSNSARAMDSVAAGAIPATASGAAFDPSVSVAPTPPVQVDPATSPRTATVWRAVLNEVPDAVIVAEVAQRLSRYRHRPAARAAIESLGPALVELLTSDEED